MASRSSHFFLLLAFLALFTPPITQGCSCIEIGAEVDGVVEDVVGGVGVGVMGSGGMVSML